MEPILVNLFCHENEHKMGVLQRSSRAQPKYILMLHDVGLHPDTKR